MTLAARLLELEQLDQEADRYEKELRGLDVAAALAQVQVEQNEVAARVKRLKQLQDRLRQGEQDVRALEKKTLALDQKLYGGMVTSPTQLAALETEMACVKSDKDRLETELLELLDQVSLLEAECAQQLARVEHAQQDLKSRENEVSQRLERIRESLLGLRRTRSELVTGLPDHTVALYSKLRAAKGTAVAMVESGTCGGCKMGLPDHKLRALAKEELDRCPNCGRILAPKP